MMSQIENKIRFENKQIRMQIKEQRRAESKL